MLFERCHEISHNFVNLYSIVSFLLLEYCKSSYPVKRKNDILRKDIVAIVLNNRPPLFMSLLKNSCFPLIVQNQIFCHFNPKVASQENKMDAGGFSISTSARSVMQHAVLRFRGIK